MTDTYKQQFIKCVARYPVLYDTQHELYRNSVYKKGIWEKIAEECDVINGNEAKRVWKNLRDSYKRIQTKKRDTLTPKVRKWQYLEDMQIFQKFLLNQNIKNDGHIKSDDEHENTNDSMYTKIQANRNIDGPTDHLIALFKENKQRISDHNPNHKNISHSELYNFFFLAYEATTKFPEHLQCEVKCKVYDIISEYEEKSLIELQDGNYDSIIEECNFQEEEEMHDQEFKEKFLESVQFDLYDDMYFIECENIVENECKKQTEVQETTCVQEAVEFVDIHKNDSKSNPVNLQQNNITTKAANTRSVRNNDRKTSQSKTANPDKPYVCDICGVACTQRANLNVHRNRHLGIKPYNCSECNKGFASSTEMKAHVVRKHTNERPYKCKSCDQSFRGLSCLIRHRQRHLSEKRFVCTMCDKRFYEKQLLRNHMVVHSGNRSHICPICNVGFKLRKILKQHMLLHSDVKKYKCKRCDKAFAQPAGVVSHMKACRQ